MDYEYNCIACGGAITAYPGFCLECSHDYEHENMKTINAKDATIAAQSRRLELAEALAAATTNLRQKYCGNCAEKWGGDTCEYCRAWEADKALRAFEEVGE